MAYRAVITGLGIIAPNGIGKNNYWHAISSGESGIKKISRFETKDYPTKIAGEIPDFNPRNYMEKRKANLLGRFSQFALVSAMMATEDSGLKIHNEDPHRMGISLGTCGGGRDVDEEQQKMFQKKGFDAIDPFSSLSISNNFAVGVIASEFGIKGPNMTVSTGCSSGLNAVAYGFDVVSSNRADIIIAGGSEAPLVPFTFNSLGAAGVLAKENGTPSKTSRPFDKYRSGYVLSEGCGIVVIEELDHALNRKAKIYAEILGYAVTNDGYSMLRMEPTGEEVANALQISLKNAGLLPEDVNYICAHGSSSLISDKRETRAIKKVFGEYAYDIPISSIKSMIGQPLAAAGSIQLITAILAMVNGCLPPTINYEYPDPECDLDYTPNKRRDCEIDVAVINSFGLGGNNSSMVVKKYNQQCSL